jgi:predicted porin
MEAMKKTLFGTTALVTAGLLASSGAHAEDGIKLGLGGYMNNYFGVGSSDPDDGTDYAPTGIYSDGEIHFLGSFTADNGITFGANVQLEAFGDTGDTIDEDFGYIEGGFGRVLFGSENTAAYLMHYAAPSVGAPINSGWVTSFVPQPSGHNAGFRTTGLSTFIDIGNDENVLTYFTPRMFGFQVGVTYAPAVVFTGNGKDFPVYANEDTEYNNGLAVGVNFVESFGSVDLAVSGGWRHASAPDAAVGADPSPPDMNQVSIGANIGFGGFTIGGSYANELDGRVTAAGVSTEGQSYDIGLSYNTGPWTVGAAYIHGEVAGLRANSDDDEMDAIRAAVEYAVGPGVTASVSGMYADWDEETGNDNNGIAGIAGITFGF